MTLLRVIFLTLAAIVLADLTATFLRWRWTPAPRTDIVVPTVTRQAVPVSVEQIVGQTRQVLGDHPSVAAIDSPNPAGASPRPTPAPVAVAPAPDPQTLMTLVGTLVGAGGTSVAFLNIGGKQQTVYSGDSVSGFTVLEIRPNTLLLSWAGGERKTLYLPSMAPAPAPAGSNVGLLPPPPAPVAAPPNPVGAPQTRPVLSRADVNQTLANPQEYLKDFRILPYAKEGRPYGMRVLDLRQGSLLNRMGVQVGDVLLSINGRNLFTPEEAMNAYQTIAKEEHVGFRVERNGQLIPLEVDIR